MVARDPFVLAAGMVLFALACTPKSGATASQVEGPDGTDKYLRIACGGDGAACRDLAKKRCPDGYSLVPKKEREKELGEGEILVRCKGKIIPPANLAPDSKPPDGPPCVQPCNER